MRGLETWPELVEILKCVWGDNQKMLVKFLVNENMRSRKTKSFSPNVLHVSQIHPII